MSYTLTLHNAEITRTQWMGPDTKVPAETWWLTGHGLSRPATDVEVDLWLRAEGGCKKLLACGLRAGHKGSCNTSA